MKCELLAWAHKVESFYNNSNEHFVVSGSTRLENIQNQNPEDFIIPVSDEIARHIVGDFSKCNVLKITIEPIE